MPRIKNKPIGVIGEIRRGSELGFKGSYKYVWQPCEFCGKERWVGLLRGKPKNKRCCSCANREIGFKRIGDKHGTWKGGRVINTQGYVICRMLNPNQEYFSMSVNGYILEHRLVMAKHLGRELGSLEIVHHKNGIRDDNRIENLELTTMGAHHKEHSKGYIDGFERGYKDGVAKQIIELKERLQKYENMS
jgi:hypothetical protein